MTCSGTQERWHQVKGWESVYSVSSCGRIRRDRAGRGAVSGRIITTKRTMKGYGYVDLSRGNRKTRRLVHQLVAEAFLGARPSTDHHPNHKDADKLNNHAANLEWTTNAENNAHARRMGLVPALPGEQNGRARLTSHDVVCIRASNGSHRSLARKFGVARTTIQAVRTGRNWRSEWPEDLRIREFPMVEKETT